MRTQGLSKTEILRNRGQVDVLFREGRRLVAHPVLAFFRETGSLAGKPMVLFSVPKRRLRKAVDRNLVRRRMREAYRLNKHILIATEKVNHCEIAFLFIGNGTPSYADLEGKIVLLLQQIRGSDEKTSG